MSSVYILDLLDGNFNLKGTNEEIIDHRAQGQITGSQTMRFTAEADKAPRQAPNCNY